jgi:protoporphyrin/coproporphyrin ferrochelatase
MSLSPFKPEPSFSHGTAAKTAVLYVNLGTPDAPTAPALRRYLAEFLSDPRVVEIPRLIWLPILYGPILTFRPKKSALKYASIWTADGSPLKVWTQKQATLLKGYLGQQTAPDQSLVDVRYAMRYGNPSVASQLDALKAEGATRVLILPAYPQYSATTTASVFDAVYDWASKTRVVPELRFVNHYHDHPAYITALAESVKKHWSQSGRAEQLVMSFHGVPERTLHLGDPYHCECHKTARLLAQALGLSPQQYKVTFQSRFGKAKWLQPYTEPTVVAMAKQGVKSVDVICPGFVADCLETLEEINQEVRHAFVAAGGQRFEYIACLNDSPTWIQALRDITATYMLGWTTTRADPAAQQDQVKRALKLGAKK